MRSVVSAMLLASVLFGACGDGLDADEKVEGGISGSIFVGSTPRPLTNRYACGGVNWKIGAVLNSVATPSTPTTPYSWTLSPAEPDPTGNEPATTIACNNRLPMLDATTYLSNLIEWSVFSWYFPRATVCLIYTRPAHGAWAFTSYAYLYEDGVRGGPIVADAPYGTVTVKLYTGGGLGLDCLGGAPLSAALR